jgi:mRNA interferase MazF
MTTTPGEVYWVDLGMIAKRRPVVVVSRRDPAAPRAVLIVAPLTTQPRGGLYEVAFPKPRWLPLESVIDVQGLRAIGVHELGHRAGVLPPGIMDKVRTALRHALDL